LGGRYRAAHVEVDKRNVRWENKTKAKQPALFCESANEKTGVKGSCHVPTGGTGKIIKWVCDRSQGDGKGKCGLLAVNDHRNKCRRKSKHNRTAQGCGGGKGTMYVIRSGEKSRTALKWGRSAGRDNVSWGRQVKVGNVEQQTNNQALKGEKVVNSEKASSSTATQKPQRGG